MPRGNRLLPLPMPMKLRVGPTYKPYEVWHTLLPQMSVGPMSDHIIIVS